MTKKTWAIASLTAVVIITSAATALAYGGWLGGDAGKRTAAKPASRETGPASPPSTRSDAEPQPQVDRDRTNTTLEPQPDTGTTGATATLPSVKKRPYKKVSAKLSYGDAASKIGLLLTDEDPKGPSSFSVDASGDFYIADQVKGSVAVFSRSGSLVRRIKIGDVPDDLAVTDSGRIFLLDPQAAHARRIDASGKTLDEGILEGLVGGATSLRSTGEKLFVTTDQMHESPVQISEGSGGLSAGDPRSGLSGISDLFAVEIGEGRAVLRRNSSEGISLKDIAIPGDGVASAVFLREDRDGMLFVQVERFVADNKVELSVMLFSASGDHVQTIKLPNDFYVWTSKMVEVSEAGNIYQLLPAKEGVYLNSWLR